MSHNETPFEMVYNALWTMAERSQYLRDWIRTGNRIKFDDPLGPKREISDNDLPELSLITSGGRTNVMETSHTCKVVRNYTWVIATGEFDINKYYNRLSWELYRSMIDWDVVLCPLIWPIGSNWNFVARCNTMDIDEGLSMNSLNRNVVGWAAVWSIEVEMHFRTHELRIP